MRLRQRLLIAIQDGAYWKELYSQAFDRVQQLQQLNNTLTAELDKLRHQDTKQ